MTNIDEHSVYLCSMCLIVYVDYLGNYGARPPGIPYQGYPPPNSNGPPQQYSPRGMPMHHGPPHQFPPYQVSF